MRIRTALTAVAAAALLAPAGASAQQIDPSDYSRLVNTLRAGVTSPVSFPKTTTNDAGRSVRTLRKGARLRSGQVVQIAEMTGPLVGDARDCSCQGFGLKAAKGMRLANVVVKAVRKGRTLAVSPPRMVSIEGDEKWDLGFTYAWERGTKPFPKGTKLVVYGLWVRA